MPNAFDEVRIAISELNVAEPNAGRFTPEFLKAIAPPETDEDRNRGYSKQRWEEYFWNIKNTLPQAEWQSQARVKWAADTTCMIIPDSETQPARSIFLRVIGAGDAVKIDWLQTGKVQTVDAYTTDPAKWTASAFLAALLEGDNLRSAGLMSPAYRAGLAPVFSKADEGRGYNPGTLAEKLRAFRGPATGFEIVAVEASAVKGVLVTPAGRKQFTIQLRTGRTRGERLVDSFTLE